MANRSIYEVDLPFEFEREGTDQDDLDTWLETADHRILMARGWRVSDLEGRLDDGGSCYCGEYGCSERSSVARGSGVLHVDVPAANQTSAIRLARLLAAEWFEEAEFDPDSKGIDWCQGPSVKFA